MTTHVALLRAVNLAGKRGVAMSDLRELFDKLGLPGARTLLQSGNVVFESAGKTADQLERALETATAEMLGVATEYFVRTAREWSEIVARNPFRAEARTDPGHLLVVVLKKAPAAPDVAALQAAIRGREVVRAVGRQAYITYPDGVGRSKLTAAMIERMLGTRGTARNWNTARKLAAAMEDPGSILTG